MRVLLVSDHSYPAGGSHSADKQPRVLPSGSAQHIHDLVARGLSQLGHEVFYLLHEGVSEPLPPGITYVADSIPSVDIVHTANESILTPEITQGVPWVASCHQHINATMVDLQDVAVKNNWIFVSRTQAAGYGSSRFVCNGIDPADHAFLEAKDDYFLFLSDMRRYSEKGLHTALEISNKCQCNLVVAGTSNNVDSIENVSQLCEQYNAKYIGDVRGEKKAGVFSRAKALLFPTQLDECCPLVIAESLMSGTPVIASNAAACAEMIRDEVGFTCDNETDYIHAMNNIDSISQQECRDYAMETFHYMHMVNNYVAEYTKQIQDYESC